jgi:hypothetical protein
MLSGSDPNHERARNMIETNSSVAQAPAPSQAQRQSMSRAVRVLVLQAAIKATKERLRARGLKPQCIAHREIVAMAEARLMADAQYRAEIVAKAKAVVLTKHQRQEAQARREAGERLTEIARSYNVSRMTISQLAGC